MKAGFEWIRIVARGDGVSSTTGLHRYMGNRRTIQECRHGDRLH